MRRIKEFDNQEKHCARCKKDFIVHDDQWAYRSGVGKDAMLFCSWKCLQAWRNNKPSRMERRYRIIQALQENPDKPYLEICRELQEEPKTVWYWKQKQEKGEI